MKFASDVRTQRPNIIGTTEVLFSFTGGTTGAFYVARTGSASSDGTVPHYVSVQGFDASRITSIYMSNGKVSPLTLNFNYMIKY